MKTTTESAVNSSCNNQNNLSTTFSPQFQRPVLQSYSPSVLQSYNSPTVLQSYHQLHHKQWNNIRVRKSTSLLSCLPFLVRTKNIKTVLAAVLSIYRCWDQSQLSGLASVSANQRPVPRSRDPSPPIRGQPQLSGKYQCQVRPGAARTRVISCRSTIRTNHIWGGGDLHCRKKLHDFFPRSLWDLMWMPWVYLVLKLKLECLMMNYEDRQLLS